LALLQGPFDTGDEAFVASFGGATYVFDAASSTSTANPALVIDGPSSVGRWLRSPSADFVVASDLALVISASSGDDANSGDSGSPLATFAEVVRRLGRAPLINATLDITFLDASVSEDVFFYPVIGNGRVQWNGSLVPLSSSVFAAAPTKRNASANTYLEVTLASAPAVEALLADASVGGEAWIVKATGGNKARCTSLIATSPTTYTTFAPEIASEASGDAYTIYTMTSFQGRFDVVAQGAAVFGILGSGMFWVQYCDFTPFGSARRPSFAARGAQMILKSCRFGTGTSPKISSANLINCLWTSTSLGAGFSSPTGGSPVLLQGGGSLISLQVTTPANVQFQTGFLFQNGEVEPTFPGAVAVLGDCMFADWSLSAIKVTGGGAVWLGIANAMSGVSASGVTIRVSCGDVINLAADTWANVIRAYGLSGAPDFTLNGKTQGSSYIPGSGLSAVETSYTIANLDQPAGAGTGFGGSASRQDARASMTRTP